MTPENNYGFQQLVDLCKQTHQEMQRRAGRSVDIHLVVRNWTQKQISQTMSAESGVNDNTFVPEGYILIPQAVSAD
jgi:hypothetical protein